MKPFFPQIPLLIELVPLENHQLYNQPTDLLPTLKKADESLTARPVSATGTHHQPTRWQLMVAFVRQWKNRLF